MVIQAPNASFSGTPTPDEHLGVRCDGCSGPIRGVRHKCSFCPDYDLCTQCKQNGTHNHHMTHEIQPPTQHTPVQYPGYPHPQTPTQYPGYPQTPTQYPGYPHASTPTPAQYPGYPQTPTQYPGYPHAPTPTPAQYPGYPQTPTQYPGYPHAPTPTPTQYPGYPHTPTQYPGYAPNATQYPHPSPNTQPSQPAQTTVSQPIQSTQTPQTGPHAVQPIYQPALNSQPPQTGPQTVTAVSQPILSTQPPQTGPPHRGQRKNRGQFHHGPRGPPSHPGHYPQGQPGHNPSGSPFPSIDLNQVHSLLQQLSMTLPGQNATNSSNSTSIPVTAHDQMTAKWSPAQAGVPSQRIKLQSSDPEYQAVIQNMNNNGGSAWTSKVLEINRIENYTLYSVYKSCKAEMEREYGPGFQNERMLWHGTHVDVLGNIYRGGFNRSYCGRNATAYGDGVYFATSFSYSASSSYSPPDSKAQKYIFQCRVLTGHFVQGKQGLKEPPMRTHELRYDSVVDNVQNPKMYVVFKDMQVYPEYVITLSA